MVNARYLKIQNILLQYLEGCHIIHFPKNTFADADHHLHLGQLHYSSNYYKYALCAMKNICVTKFSWSIYLKALIEEINDDIFHD